MILDLKARSKLIKQTLPELKKKNCYNDTENKGIAKQIINLEQDIVDS